MATTEKRLVRVELPNEVHDQLRVVAATRGVPMSQFAREVLVEVVKKEMEKISRKFAKTS